MSTYVLNESDIDRFVSKIEEQDHGYDTLCWQWMAGTFNSGYGNFGLWYGDPPKVHSVRAHKWAYEQIIGPVPDGMVLDHKCRNILCCNPDHVEPVTQRENSSRGLQGDLKPGRTSRYRGVSWDKQTDRWIVKIKLNGTQYNLGYYDDEEEGHQVYEFTLAAYEQDGTVPFAKKRIKTSKYKGVSKDPHSGTWKAVFTQNDKRITVRGFITEEEAYQAYLDSRGAA